MINCLVIEDELAAQKVLLNYMEKTPYLRCSGVYETGIDVPLRELENVDLIFLDIQLPEINGIAFLRTLINPPHVIFTTAFSEYSLEAFDVAAIDYLLKPFSYERFIKATTRIRHISEVENQTDVKEHFFVYTDKTYYKIKRYDISYIKSEVDYVRIYMSLKSLMILDSLSNWEEKLQGDSFFRVHRSYIININKVEKIKNGQISILKETIPIGKKYKDRFIQALKKNIH